MSPFYQVEDAKRLVEFSKNVDAGGSVFKILETLEVERDQNFGRSFNSRAGGRPGGKVSSYSRGGNFENRSPRYSYDSRGPMTKYSPQGRRFENRGADHEFRGADRNGRNKEWSADRSGSSNGYRSPDRNGRSYDRSSNSNDGYRSQSPGKFRRFDNDPNSTW